MFLVPYLCICITANIVALQQLVFTMRKASAHATMCTTDICAWIWLRTACTYIRVATVVIIVEIECLRGIAQVKKSR